MPLQSAHETLARAWVLWRLGLCSEAGRVAARLASKLPTTPQGDDDEADALLAGVVDILRAAGRHSLAQELLQARVDRCGEGQTSAAQQA
jgi:hypothetical protein